jgi:outer membrane protein TolC
MNARLNKKIATLNRDTEVRKLTEKENFLRRQVQASYANALTSKSQKDFRQKAVKELQRSFNQGRTDISLLIEALNRYSAAEVNYAVTLGQYQIALNEWAAFRDELIPSQLEDK